MGSEVKMGPIILAARTTHHTSKLLSFNGALLITTRTHQECSNIRRDKIKLPRCTDLVWTYFYNLRPMIVPIYKTESFFMICVVWCVNDSYLMHPKRFYCIS